MSLAPPERFRDECFFPWVPGHHGFFEHSSNMFQLRKMLFRFSNLFRLLFGFICFSVLKQFMVLICILQLMVLACFNDILHTRPADWWTARWTNVLWPPPSRSHMAVRWHWCSRASRVISYWCSSQKHDKNMSGWWFQPLWKIWKSAGMIIPNIWKNKKWSKPPVVYMKMLKAKYG